MCCSSTPHQPKYIKHSGDTGMGMSIGLHHRMLTALMTANSKRTSPFLWSQYSLHDPQRPEDMPPFPHRPRLPVKRPYLLLLLSLDILPPLPLGRPRARHLRCLRSRSARRQAKARARVVRCVCASGLLCAVSGGWRGNHWLDGSS